MSENQLTITILGSGTSTGVPVIGCRCAVCSSSEPRNLRTRCSALLSWGGRNVLIDSSTDLRQQALREGLSHIDAVLYTHTHADHVHGIDDLRAFNPPGGEAIPIYASHESVAAIHRGFGYIFSDTEASGYRPRLTTCAVEGAFELFGQSIKPLPLIHGPGRSLGYRIGDFAYLTDCSAVPEASEAQLRGLGLLVLDGLRFKPHANHFNIPQAIEFAARVGAERTLLTHLTHDIDHLRHAPLLPDGVELAFDGQRIVLPFPLKKGAQSP